MTTTKPTAATMKLATKIALQLFTTGGGSKAFKLKLIDEDGFYLGGWSFSPAVDQIAAIIEAAKPKPKRKAAPHASK